MFLVLRGAGGGCWLLGNHAPQPPVSPMSHPGSLGCRVREDHLYGCGTLVNDHWGPGGSPGGLRSLEVKGGPFLQDTCRSKVPGAPFPEDGCRPASRPLCGTGQAVARRCSRDDCGSWLDCNLPPVLQGTSPIFEHQALQAR